MSGCPATNAAKERCEKKMTFPTDAPLVCGNHKHKINEDGQFDDSLKIVRTPPLLAKSLLALLHDLDILGAAQTTASQSFS
jgi:hypothetical protein